MCIRDRKEGPQQTERILATIQFADGELIFRPEFKKDSIERKMLTAICKDSQSGVVIAVDGVEIERPFRETQEVLLNVEISKDELKEKGVLLDELPKFEHFDHDSNTILNVKFAERQNNKSQKKSDAPPTGNGRGNGRRNRPGNQRRADNG